MALQNLPGDCNGVRVSGSLSLPAKQQQKRQAARKRPANGQKRKNGPARKKRNNQSGGRPAAAAAAYAQGVSTTKAQVFRNSVDSCRIVHRELLNSITGSANFTVAVTTNVNPGLPAAFPWLSTQALGWEKYHFNKLRFCCYTRTGTSTPGSLILAVDYDAADAAPLTEQIASSYYGTVEDAPWKDLCMPLDPKRLAGERFVRTGNLAANLDIKTYDVANLFVCTTDGTAVNWSKYWVEYDITLMNPALPSSGAQTLSSALVSAGGSVAAATPFGAAPTYSGPLTLAAAGTNIITLSGLVIGGVYFLNLDSVGTVISAYSLTSPTGMTIVSTAFAGYPAAATSAAAISSYTATATVATVTLSITATTITSTLLTVLRYS